MKRNVWICTVFGSFCLFLLPLSSQADPDKAFKDCPECPEMVVIPAGSFEMGSSRNDDDGPVHRVTFRQAFALSKTEVTQTLWKVIMGNNPSEFQSCGESCPVENVSWNDANEFIKKLNDKTGKQYRLPSEAEWEYAARAGTNTSLPWGDQASHEYANYGKEECCAGLSQGRDKWVNTSPVASFPANAFGLYDMIGNVWEWVEDSNYFDYNGAPTDGSSWQGDGKYRVLRGQSWLGFGYILRTTYRARNVPGHRGGDIGFRIARNLP